MSLFVRVAAVVATALLASSACGGGSPSAPATPKGGLILDGEQVASQQLYEAAQKEGVLVAYMSFPEAITKSMLAAFTKDTGIKVELVRLPTNQLYQRIKAEKAGGKLTADVISMSELGLMNEVVKDGTLVPYKVPNHDQIPSNLKDPTGAYYAEIRSLMVFAYNTKLVKSADAPKSWADITDPKWTGKIGYNHAGSGGASWTVALYQRQTYGQDYWKKLAAQKPVLTNAVGALTDQLARGEVSLTVNHLGTVKVAIRDNGAPIGIVYPKEGAPSFYEAIGTTSVGQHPNAAKLYLNWAMSKAGGSRISEASGEYAANPAAKPPKEPDGSTSPSIDKLNIWVPKPDDYLNLRTAWLADWNKDLRYTG
jgi:iron(III) transport system substrate-binding protein